MVDDPSDNQANKNLTPSFFCACTLRYVRLPQHNMRSLDRTPHIISPVVVALHLVVEYLPLLRGGVGDQLSFDDLEDVVADVCQLRLDLGLVVADQGQLVALRREKCANMPSTRRAIAQLQFEFKRRNRRRMWRVGRCQDGWDSVECWMLLDVLQNSAVAYVWVGVILACSHFFRVTGRPAASRFVTCDSRKISSLFFAAQTYTESERARFLHVQSDAQHPVFNTHHGILALDGADHPPRRSARADHVLVGHGKKVAFLHGQLLGLLRDSLHVVHHFIEAAKKRHRERERRRNNGEGHGDGA